jgi:hypothetical protein
MYKLNQNSSNITRLEDGASNITRLEDGASIPDDVQNIDYAAYLEWLAEGNTPEAADPISEPVPAPTLVEQILASPDDLQALKAALGL